MLEREPAVAGEVVGVRVRLDDPDDPHAAPVGLGQHRLDRVRGIDDRGDARVLVADQIRGAAEIVVEELLEEHGPSTLPLRPAASEAQRGEARCQREQRCRRRTEADGQRATPPARAPL